MTRTAQGLALLMVAVLAPSAVAAEPLPLSEERINALAAMLPARPAGVGRPITDRAAWRELAKHESFAGIVTTAEKLAAEPIPETSDELFLDYSRTGNRTRWDGVTARRRGRVGPLVLAECVEDRGRFLPAIEEIVRELCAERVWVMSAHDTKLTNFRGETIDVDLASSSLAWTLATTDYVLGDRLSDETRALIRENVNRRVIEPYADMIAGRRQANWWTRTTSNWNAVCLAGVTGAALALVESPQERAVFVAAAEEYSKNFLKGFPPDGYCTEGVGYWNYGFGHYVLLAETLWQATGGGVDFMQRPGALEPARFGERIGIADGAYPAFADCTVGARPDERLMYFVDRRLGLVWQHYAARDPVGPRGYLFEALIHSFTNSARHRIVTARGSGILGKRSWFSHAGILIGRPGDGGSRLAVALKGGHNNEHHNHNDVGSFVVAVGSQAVLLDPGSEVYTARTFSRDRYVSKVLNSYGHPVPVVAGQLQRTGREAEGRVVRTDFTDEADTLVLDLSSAYDVPELLKLERTFVYSRRAPGSLRVMDEVTFAEPKAFGTALITFGRWKQTAPGELQVFDTEEFVRVDVDTGGLAWKATAEEINEDLWVRKVPLRIGIDLAEPVTEARISLTITPLPPKVATGGGLPNGGFEEEGWAWSIPRKGMGSIVTDRAATGAASLRLVDADDVNGSNIDSARVPVPGAGRFELRGMLLPVSGSGLGMYVRYLGADGEDLNEKDARGWFNPILTLGGESGEWEPFAQPFETPPGTMHVQLWIHSFTSARVEAYLDDLGIVPAD